MSDPNKAISLTSISVYCQSAAQTAKAEKLAHDLKLRLATIEDDQCQLVVTEHHVELRIANLGKPIWIDFLSGKNAHRRQFGGGRGQPLAKALSLKKAATPTIVDTTAGFGRDAFVMASLGCNVTLLERNPIIACLLQDALERAREDDTIADIVQRMAVFNIDACDYLTNPDTSQPDVIYMDPMYPNRNKSALVKKEMQLLHQLVGPDLDSEQLLSIARQKALKRVVVKRPKSAEPIANSKPDTSIVSKNTRYDIYLS